YSTPFSTLGIDRFYVGCDMSNSEVTMFSSAYYGYFSNLIICGSGVTETTAVQVHSGDLGYEVVILAGQSNMRGASFIRPGIDDDYSEVEGKVFQYKYTDSTVVPATNPLFHFESESFTNRMGSWLEFAKHYVKYIMK